MNIPKDMALAHLRANGHEKFQLRRPDGSRIHMAESDEVRVLLHTDSAFAVGSLPFVPKRVSTRHVARPMRISYIQMRVSMAIARDAMRSAGTPSRPFGEDQITWNRVSPTSYEPHADHCEAYGPVTRQEFR